MTFCIFRTDRIGDVLLTLPLAAALKRHDSQSRVVFCVRDYTADLVRLCSDVDDMCIIPNRDVSIFSSAFSSQLREHSIDVAVFAFPRFGLAYAAWRAHIPVRIGTAYRLYSPLFTHRRKEHRRGGVEHESRYNLSLLDTIGVDTTQCSPPRLYITDELRALARQALAAAGIREGERFVVIHPGSGGSAKDWPPEYFGALAAQLLHKASGVRVLVTGTQTETALKKTVVATAGEGAGELSGESSLSLLAAVLEQAELVVANSTGPLHLAAAVGRPLVALYPFQQQTNPRRWKPLGDADIFTPLKDEFCQGCISENCDIHDDMSRITVEEVFVAVCHRLGI